jgi:hypothetical protein
MAKRYGKGAFGGHKRRRDAVKTADRRKTKLAKMAAQEHGLRTFLGDLKYKDRLDEENRAAEEPEGMDMGEDGTDEETPG